MLSIAWGFLRPLLTNWRFWALLGILASYGWTYYRGWSSAHDDHLEYVAAAQQQTAIMIRVQREREVQSANTIKESDARRTRDLGTVGRAFADWVRGHPGDPPAGEKPAPITSRVCDDPARDQGLSDAIQRYLDGVRAATAALGAGIARLLEQAQRQTVDLVNLQETVLRLKMINEMSLPAD